MLEKQRQQLILDILDEQQFVHVKSLSEQLDSSEATIRRDLLKLSQQNKIKKIRGGAQAVNFDRSALQRRSLSSSAFLVAKQQQPEVKRLIAKKAVELCSDGESIIINGGSSTFMMGEFLLERELNILTNSFVLAQELTENSDNNLILPGGEIYRKQGIILSAFENDTIQYYSMDKMFMGTPGIGEYGVTESDTLLIRSEQKLLKQADKLIVLADSSKLGRKSNFILCPLEEVDILITDSNADEKHLKVFHDKNIEVIIVDAPDS